MTLPPQEAPKQLTARQVCENLGEHYEAFLAANNIKGWVIDDHVLDYSHIADVLFRISATTGLYVGRLSNEGGHLRSLAKKAGSDEPLHFWLNCAARALGYPSYFLAHRCRKENGFVQNLWPEGALMNPDDFGEELPANKEHRRIVAAMHRNYRANKLRDTQFNQLRRALEAASKEGSRVANHRWKELKKSKKDELKKQKSIPLQYRIS